MLNYCSEASCSFFKMEMELLENNNKQYLFCYYPGAQNWKAFRK